jgi:hypothetical protein
MVVDVVEGATVVVVETVGWIVVVDGSVCAVARSDPETKSVNATDPASAILRPRPRGRSR